MACTGASPETYSETWPIAFFFPKFSSLFFGFWKSVKEIRRITLLKIFFKGDHLMEVLFFPTDYHLPISLENELF